MDANEKQNSEKNPSTTSSGGDDLKSASPAAPVPTPPQLKFGEGVSQTSASHNITPDEPVEAPPSAEVPSDAPPATENIHEYRDVADGVQARVRTPEERAADVPPVPEGIEVTTASK